MPSRHSRKTPSRDAILRAVASSTAIETGERVASIEARLREGQHKVPHLTLARDHSAKPARG